MREYLIIVKFSLKSLGNTIFRFYSLINLLTLIFAYKLSLSVISISISTARPMIIPREYEIINVHSTELFIMTIFSIVVTAFHASFLNRSAFSLRDAPIRGATKFLMYAVPILSNFTIYSSMYLLVCTVRAFYIDNFIVEAYFFVLYLLFILPLHLIACIPNIDWTGKELSITNSFSSSVVMMFAFNSAIHSDKLNCISFGTPPGWIVSAMSSFKQGDFLWAFIFSSLFIAFVVWLMRDVKYYLLGPSISGSSELGSAASDKCVSSPGRDAVKRYSKHDPISSIALHSAKSLSSGRRSFGDWLIIFFCIWVIGIIVKAPWLIFLYFTPLTVTLMRENASLVFCRTLPVPYRSVFGVKVAMNTAYNAAILVAYFAAARLSGSHILAHDFQNIIASCLALWLNFILGGLFLAFIDELSGEIKYEIIYYILSYISIINFAVYLSIFKYNNFNAIFSVFSCFALFFFLIVHAIAFRRLWRL